MSLANVCYMHNAFKNLKYKNKIYKGKIIWTQDKQFAQYSQQEY